MPPIHNRILLIQPRATRFPGFRMPLNLLQLSAPLINSGFTVDILDFHIESLSESEIAKRTENILFVGISCFTGLQSAEAIRIGKLLKRINPNLKLVWGGYHPSLWSDLAIKSDIVDFVIRGAGENSLLELADKLNSGEIVEKQIFDQPPIAQIPSPAINLINPEKYIASTLIGNRVLNINTSYSCAHTCSFCAVHKAFPKGWIAKPSDQVVDEIEYLKRNHSIDGLEFSDNAPFIDQNRMLKIAQEILARKINIKWMSMARADELLRYSDDEWNLLVKSGFSRVFVGVESGDNVILDSINKNESRDIFLNFAVKCAQHNLIPDYSFTLGYPPNPDSDIEHSFSLIRELKKITPSGTVMFYRYTPYSLDDPNSSQIQFPSRWEDWADSKWESWSLTSSKTPWMTQKSIRKISNFQTVLTCAYHHEEAIFPTDGSLSLLLSMIIPIARYRWQKGYYNSPCELKVLRRLFLSCNPSHKGTIAT
jgi:anaerobic magnesium-protoporphyrin IX monomethyl ester cyclase